MHVRAASQQAREAMPAHREHAQWAKAGLVETEEGRGYGWSGQEEGRWSPSDGAVRGLVLMGWCSESDDEVGEICTNEDGAQEPMVMVSGGGLVMQASRERHAETDVARGSKFFLLTSR